MQESRRELSKTTANIIFLYFFLEASFFYLPGPYFTILPQTFPKGADPTVLLPIVIMGVLLYIAAYVFRKGYYLYPTIIALANIFVWVFTFRRAEISPVQWIGLFLAILVFSTVTCLFIDSLRARRPRQSSGERETPETCSPE